LGDKPLLTRGPPTRKSAFAGVLFFVDIARSRKRREHWKHREHREHRKRLKHREHLGQMGRMGQMGHLEHAAGPGDLCCGFWDFGSGSSHCQL